jgi:hypothetical protein
MSLTLSCSGSGLARVTIETPTASWGGTCNSHDLPRIRDNLGLLFKNLSSEEQPTLSPEETASLQTQLAKKFDDIPRVRILLTEQQVYDFDDYGYSGNQEMELPMVELLALGSTMDDHGYDLTNATSSSPGVIDLTGCKTYK